MTDPAGTTGTAGPIQRASLSRLIQFLMQLSREKAYANVKVVIQRAGSNLFTSTRPIA